MDWEARYQTNDTPWDKGGAAHPALVRFLQEGVPATAWLKGVLDIGKESESVRAAFGCREAGAGAVLVPGCGFGADVRAIVAAGRAAARDAETSEEQLRVLGIDIAPTAVRRAKELSASLSERQHAQHAQQGPQAEYEVVDLFALPEQYRAAFDALWEHTCFCAIDPAARPRYVAGAQAALKPGGFLLAVFYINPDMEPGEEGPPFGVTPGELDTFFDPAFERIAEWEPETFPMREGRELVRLYRRRD